MTSSPDTYEAADTTPIGRQLAAQAGRRPDAIAMLEPGLEATDYAGLLSLVNGLKQQLRMGHRWLQDLPLVNRSASR